MYVKAELLILGVLKALGHHSPFRTLKTDTKISPLHHRSFFHFFIDQMYRIRSKFINYPSTQDELKNVMGRYKENFLPYCGGSVDVVHLKTTKCPAGDYNHSKGKEGYPSVAFEVITGYERQILGVSSVRFGTQNDQQIVRTDETLSVIKNGSTETCQNSAHKFNYPFHFTPPPCQQQQAAVSIFLRWVFMSFRFFTNASYLCRYFSSIHHLWSYHGKGRKSAHRLSLVSRPTPLPCQQQQAGVGIFLWWVFMSCTLFIDVELLCLKRKFNLSAMVLPREQPKLSPQTEFGLPPNTTALTTLIGSVGYIFVVSF